MGREQVVNAERLNLPLGKVDFVADNENFGVIAVVVLDFFEPVVL